MDLKTAIEVLEKFRSATDAIKNPTMDAIDVVIKEVKKGLEPPTKEQCLPGCDCQSVQSGHISRTCPIHGGGF
jgi:hypothetical protein